MKIYASKILGFQPHENEAQRAQMIVGAWMRLISYDYHGFQWKRLYAYKYAILCTWNILSTLKHEFISSNYNKDNEENTHFERFEVTTCWLKTRMGDFKYNKCFSK